MEGLHVEHIAARCTAGERLHVRWTSDEDFEHAVCCMAGLHVRRIGRDYGRGFF